MSNLIQRNPTFTAALLLLSLAGCSAVGGCHGGPPPEDDRRGGSHEPPPAMQDPAFAKAFDTCLAEQGVAPARPDASQDKPERPEFDRRAMHACLKAKGVEVRMPPPPPRQGR